METKEIFSRRQGKIIEFGASVGLTLREELLSLELRPQDPVQVSVEINENSDREIIIRKVK